jgi:hypothetical protein
VVIICSDIFEVSNVNIVNPMMVLHALKSTIVAVEQQPKSAQSDSLYNGYDKENPSEADSSLSIRT